MEELEKTSNKTRRLDGATISPPAVSVFLRDADGVGVQKQVQQKKGVLGSIVKVPERERSPEKKDKKRPTEKNLPSMCSRENPYQ